MKIHDKVQSCMLSSKQLKDTVFMSLKKYFRNLVFPKFLITENSNRLEKVSSISLRIKPCYEIM